MNAIRFVVIAFVLAFSASGAQAQTPMGTYAYCNGVWRFGGCSGTIAPVQQFASLPNGGGFNRCEAIGGIVGGTLGSLNKAHPLQAVILGAVAGGVAGHFICSNPQGQQVVVPMAQPQPVMTVQQNRNTCWEPNDDRKMIGTLSWPGHPKDGQKVCAYPGDPNIKFF